MGARLAWRCTYDDRRTRFDLGIPWPDRYGIARTGTDDVASFGRWWIEPEHLFGSVHALVDRLFSLWFRTVEPSRPRNRIWHRCFGDDCVDYCRNDLAELVQAWPI